MTILAFHRRIRVLHRANRFELIATIMTQVLINRHIGTSQNCFFIQF